MGRIVVIGNSHTYALKRACRDQNVRSIAIHWLWRANGAASKNGDIRIDDAADLVSSLGDDDLLALHFYGTLHVRLSLLMHEQPFDVADRDGNLPDVGDDGSIIPTSVLRQQFTEHMKRTHHVHRILSAARCKTVFLMTPPPTSDDDGIALHLQHKGVPYNINPAPRRLRVWHLEHAAVSDYVSGLGYELLPIPRGTTDSDGYLLYECSAHDAGHASQRYGAAVVEQLIEAKPPAVPPQSITGNT